MGIRTYLRVIAMYWPIVTAGLVIGLVGAGVVTLATPSTYASSVTMILSTQRTSSDSSLDYEGTRVATEKAKSYVQLLTNQQLASEVVGQLGLDVDPTALAQSVTASLQPETALITARVTDRSPLGAQQIAATLSDRFVALIAALEQSEDPASPPALAARIVQPATLSTQAVSPLPVLNLVLGGLLGFLAGLAGAVVRDRAQRPVLSVDDMADATGSPPLGAVGLDPFMAHQPLAVVDRPDGRSAEAFRRIRANMGLREPGRPGKVTAVVSLAYGDGRTVTACNLAVAIARTHRKVVLVDADLRRPGISEVMGLGRTRDLPGSGRAVGLGDVLYRNMSLQSAMQPWRRRNTGLDVLAAGQLPPDPGDVLASHEFRRLVADLADSYDVVLLDTPPLGPVSDALAIAPLCDDVILVVRHRKTGLRELRSAVEALQAISARIAGSIMNGVSRTGVRAVRTPANVPAYPPHGQPAESPRTPPAISSPDDPGKYPALPTA